MADQDPQTKAFPLANKGIVTKLDPALLSDGQLQNAYNIISLQEGNITVTRGRFFLGILPGAAPAPHRLTKLSIPRQTISIMSAVGTDIVIGTDTPHGWQTGFIVNILEVGGNTNANGQWTITVVSPSSFSLNGSASGPGVYVNGGVATLVSGDPSIRYIGEKGTIFRSLDNYATLSNPTPVGGVMGGYDPITYRWSMAAFNAGSTGNPFAFFACPGLMLKDQGNNPSATLQNWGISPGLAAAGLSAGAGSPVAVLGVTASGTLIEIQTTVAHGFSNGQTITITLIVGTIEANGTWVITVIDATHFTLNNSLFLNAYVSGGSCILSAADSSQPGAAPYDYVYTYRNPASGSEGNPSAFMATKASITNGLFFVVIWGSPDPQIAGVGSVAIYRRGGSFSDGIFRLVGRIVNPGVDGTGKPFSATFTDTTPDYGLLFAQQLEMDNDAPVTSTLRFPINATIVSGSPDLKGGQWVTLTLSLPINTTLTVGTKIYVGSSTAGGGGNNQETCIIAALPYTALTANTTCLVFLQLEHTAGEPIFVDSVAGQACGLVLAAFDSLFVAGDPNNPQALYKSKTGRPESFPVITSSGVSGSINIGTPSDGIQNICEFRGKILSLNVSDIFEVDIFQGVMVGPVRTPCQRGLIARWAFAKSEGEVFFLSYDGIWSWNGGSVRKVSEAIDTLFHGQAVTTETSMAGISPVDMSPAGLKYARMAYYRSQLYFIYLDMDGKMNRIRYDILYDRWLPDASIFNTTASGVLEMMLEEDTLAFVFARANAAGGIISRADFIGTLGSTDETSLATGLGGNAIPYAFQTAFFVIGTFDRLKLMQDLILELKNSEAVTVDVFYDYSPTPDGTDTFTIAPNATRVRVPLPLGLSGGLPLGREAFAISVRVSGISTGSNTFYSMAFRSIDRDSIQSGYASDWMNLGTNNDKRFFQLHLEHNTGGNDVTLEMDIRYGINGTSQANNVASWVLNSSDKTTVTLPIPESGFPGGLTIAKSIRLRPVYVSGHVFRIFLKPTFDKEDLPPDITLFTEWEDDGYQLDKYAQELMIDVDTAGRAVPVQVQADGATLQTITATTTNADRHRNITLSPNLKGRQWRLFVDPAVIPAGGKFQVYRSAFQFQKADKGPVNHTFDYDDLGTPFDKRLQTVSFEFDTTVGGQFTIQMDTLSGLSGNTLTAPAQTFILPAGGRGRKTFAIFDGTIIKMVRMYPVADNVGSKVWSYTFQKIDYPPDVVLFTEWADDGYPFDKYAQELMVEVDTNSQTVPILVEVDGVAVQTVTVTTSSDDRHRNLTLGPNLIGKQWRIAVSLGSIPAGGKFQLFKSAFQFQKADKGPVNHTFDYDDLGTPFDKMLQVVTFEFDTTISGPFTINMDTLSGITGNVSTVAAQVFVLPATGRGKKSFAVNDDIICKMVRMYPATPGNLVTFQGAKVWSYTFQKIDYPADTVLFTDWADNDYPLSKFAQELMVEVDTNGQVIPVQVQADGVTMQTVTMVTTWNDRHRNITLAPNLQGRQWRLLINPAVIPAGGKFQLFKHQFQFQNADKGPVNHTFDYDDLGWPYDKALSTVTFEFDTSNGGSFTIAMDTVSGIDGATLTVAAQVFVLPATGRGKKTFAVNVGTIVKMVRMYPLTDNVGSKQWGYSFQKKEYPPDTVTFTEPQDFGYPCEKIARNLIIEVDTGGVQANITVQADGVNVQTFPIKTTYTNRMVIIPFSSSPVQPIGRLWRLLTAPGIGGKAQIFNWSLDFIKEPCQVASWDSYEISFGYNGWKLLKQIWIEYVCAAPITYTVMVDGGRIFYTVTLPAHANRDVERFYVPDAVGSVLNKSKIYRIQLASTTTAGLKAYLETSRIEWAPIGGDQRGAYQQMPLSEATAFAA